MTLVLASMADVTVIIAVALLATIVLRRGAAALRHLVLAVAIVASLMVPVLELLVPQWPLVRWGDASPVVSSSATIASVASTASMSDATVVSQPLQIPWVAIAVGVWTIGAVTTLAGLVIALARLRRVSVRCTPLREGRWRDVADDLTARGHISRPVALMQSTERSLLVTYGVLRPHIILPAGTSEWTDAQRRSVLNHEFAHVRRFDGMTQLAGEMLRVLYWFNPLVWVACQRLRQECEHACDDAVLRGGVEPTEYATHLLDVARHAAGAQRVWAPVPAIAHPSTLERRIADVLNHSRDRRPVSRGVRFVAALSLMALVLPVAAAGIASPDRPVDQASLGDVTLVGVPMTVKSESQASSPIASSSSRPVVIIIDDADSLRVSRTTVAETTVAETPARATEASASGVTDIAQATQTPAVVSGTMVDQTGGALPGVQMLLKDTMFGLEYSTTSDNNGRFAFRSVPAAQYLLEARLAGFTTVTNVVPARSSATQERRIIMPLGTLQEVITLMCSSPAVAAVAPSAPTRTRSTADALTRVNELWSRLRRSVVVEVSAQQAGEIKPVRVGGQIKAPAKLTDVKPACPPVALPDDGTTVQLVGRIGVDGVLNDLRHQAGTGTPPPSEFLESALDAVRRWRFTTALLNGTPVEVNLSVLVRYQS